MPEALHQIILEQLDSPSQGVSSLSVDDTIAEALREVLTERLAQVGFDSAYRLSPEGALLEDLIDKLGG
jgi:hypothetical protein